jgi:hypothetical protein
VSKDCSLSGYDFRPPHGPEICSRRFYEEILLLSCSSESGLFKLISGAWLRCAKHGAAEPTLCPSEARPEADFVLAMHASPAARDRFDTLDVANGFAVL